MPKNRKLTYSDRQSQASRDKKLKTVQPAPEKPANDGGAEGKKDTGKGK